MNNINYINVLGNMGAILTNGGALIGIGACILFCMVIMTIGIGWDKHKGRSSEGGGFMFFLIIVVIGLLLMGAVAPELG